MTNNTVTIGSWDEEAGMYTYLQQIPVVASESDELTPPGSLVYVTRDCGLEAGIYLVSEGGEVIQTTNEPDTDTTNQEGTTMNTNNDGISRTALLSVLESREMTQGEVIELVRGAAPLEVDSVHNPYVTPPSIHIEGCRGGYGYGYVPDHMG